MSILITETKSSVKFTMELVVKLQHIMENECERGRAPYVSEHKTVFRMDYDDIFIRDTLFSSCSAVNILLFPSGVKTLT